MNDEVGEQVRKKPPITAVALTILITSIAIYVGWWVYVWTRWQEPDGGFADAGTFGDAFGAINALFSGLAMVSVAVTLWVALRQNEYSAKQAVQTQFFQMLASWQAVVEHVAFFDKVPLHGRAALNEVASRLRSKVAPIIQSGDGTVDPVGRRAVVQDGYDRVLWDNRVDLGHYFRLLYHIIRFIDRSTVLTTSEKQDLTRIVRAHFSDAEFTLLFYNCLLPVGENLFPLVEKYDLFQNIGDGCIVHRTDLDFYPQTKARWEKKGRQFKRFVA